MIGVPTGMPARDRTAYLFLLRRPSAAARREAANRLREVGAQVVAQYGDGALEALVTPDQARALAESGMFLAQLKGPMSREHLAKLGDEQRRVVELWNARSAAGFRRLGKDRSLRERSWGEEERDAPRAYSTIDPEDFFELVNRYQESTGERLLPHEPDRDYRRRPSRKKDFTADEFAAYERRLAERYKDERLAYELARLAVRLGPGYYELVADLPDWLIEAILELFFREAACWRMTGEMSVGLVFVESSQSGGPKFTATERNEVCNEILTGLNWLSSEHPDGNLSWVYDFQFITIDVADGDNDSEESYWRDPAMAEVVYDGNTYSASWSAVADYREDMRLNNRSAHAFVVFVTPYGNSWHAYAGGGRVTLARRNNWGGWGRGTIDMITAHEASHLFGAADEYTGSGTPCSSCSTTHGCDNIPNGNCGACARPRQSCVMDGNSQRLCGYTRGQIGWSDLFVELQTADELWAGTDDDVTIDIGDHVFTLDTLDHDDRERGNREGYPIWAPWLRREDVKRVLIRKSPDGFAGGWKLSQVRVWFRGALLCDSSPNRWLEDDKRWWMGCVSDRGLVNTLRVKVTTADVSWAGTDDDVTLTLAGRNWDLDNEGHDDFERGHTDAFDLDPRTGLRQSDIHAVRVHKSPDGIAGGWKLKGIEIIVNGSTFYNNQSINRWLEDDDRTWSASI
jgi:hypothetical protein